jgi:hypothetical protein
MRSAIAIRRKLAHEFSLTRPAVGRRADLEREAGGVSTAKRGTGLAEMFEKTRSDVTGLSDENPLPRIRECINSRAIGRISQNGGSGEHACGALCKSHSSA